MESFRCEHFDGVQVGALVVDVDGSGVTDETNGELRSKATFEQKEVIGAPLVRLGFEHMVFLFGSALSYWAGSEEVIGVVPYPCSPLVGVKEYLDVDVLGLVDYFTECFCGIACHV